VTLPVPQPTESAPESPRNARARARAEKAYRKASRPLWHKKRFIIPVALVVFVILVSVISGGSTSGPTTATGSPCAASYLDKQSTDICADGASTVTMEGLTVTATPLTDTDTGIGGTSLCSDITIGNPSGQSADYNALNFKIQSPSGDVGTANTMDIGSTLNSGTLVAGGTKTGRICSDQRGPATAGQYVLIYKPNPFESARGVWLSNR
jgi:hypothetical protein